MHVCRMSALSCLALTVVGIIGCASRMTDHDSLPVLDNSTEGAASRVGILNSPSFERGKTYELVLSPRLDAIGEPIIPESVDAAHEELSRMLDDDYRSAFRLVKTSDQTGQPFYSCETRNETADFLLRHWLVVYWDLRKRNERMQPLNVESSSLKAASTADVLMMHLCKR